MRKLFALLAIVILFAAPSCTTLGDEDLTEIIESGKVTTSNNDKEDVHEKPGSN